MKKNRLTKTFLGIALSITLVAGTMAEVEARPGRGGGRASGARATRTAPQSGSYQRGGNRSWQNGQGQTRQHQYQGQGSWQRGNGEASKTYRGTVTNQNGQTGNVERNANWRRNENGYTKDYNRSVTGENGGRNVDGTKTWSKEGNSATKDYSKTVTNQNGQSKTVEGSTTWTNNGDGTYNKEGSRSVTGPNGETRTGTTSGSGSVTKTENGVSKTYNGTLTNGQGQSYDVNRQADYSRNGDGTGSRNGSHSLTDSDGNVVRSGNSSTLYTPGQGTETTGSRTNSQGTRYYEGSNQRTEDGRVYNGAVTNGQGETLQERNVRWQYVDGRWVKTAEGGNGAGGSYTSEGYFETTPDQD